MRQAVGDLLQPCRAVERADLGRPEDPYRLRVGRDGGRPDDFGFVDYRHHFASGFMSRVGSPQTLKELLGPGQHKLSTRLVGHGRVRGEG